MKRLASIGNKLAPYITAFLLLSIWEVAVRLNHLPSYILPSPLQIIKTLAGTFPLLLMHTASTLEEAMLGFILAILIAFLTAFVLDYFYWLNQAVYPLLIVSQTIPIITLAPLFLIWFGWGLLPKIIVVILVCFFPIVISLLNGLNSVDPDLINLFRSMGASRIAIFKMVKLPSALSVFFSGLKISASYSIMAAVIGEWLGAEQGLGYFMTIAQKSFRVDRVLAAVVVIALLSLLVVKAIDLAEWLVVPWKRKQEEREIN
ncbi:MAG: ABC transporter permease [Firmicutes bacterium HGW-Firmicutes-15]|nr:MAG: ABC transporter permease [Firmicutes bacterium HGW-Firmicutes-15]